MPATRSLAARPPRSARCTTAPSQPAPPLPSRRALLRGAAAAALLLQPPSLLRPPLAAALPLSAEADAAVRQAVSDALARLAPLSRAPALLRLAFHDAGTYRPAAGGAEASGGPNASVLFELDRPESFGLRRATGPLLAVSDALRSPGGAGAIPAAAALSTADLIQLAAAHAVLVTGGPAVVVPLGRLDAPGADPEGRLPAETLDGPGLRSHFGACGYSVQELVALSGAHTLGAKGFGEPLAFDGRAYYRTLLAAPWDDAALGADARAMAAHTGLPSDRALARDAQCREWVQRYADDEQAWRADFAAAFLKMGTMGARWA